VKIVYTGLRPGEKLHEVLFGPDEVAVALSHGLISHVPVPPLAAAAIGQLDLRLPRSALVNTLRELALRSYARPAADLNRTGGDVLRAHDTLGPERPPASATA
jgi:FlaA1/EpsC-like NDP-sugar epimerase